MSDSLEQLLRSADAANPAPDRMPDLAAAVRQHGTRRRRMRLAGATVTATSLVVMFVTVLTIRRATPPAPAPIAIAPAAAPAELSMQTQARLSELTIERLESRRERRRATAESISLSSAPSPGELRDRAALILIYDADQHLQSQRRDDAVAIYRRTIELFPQSHWADVARKRLKQFET